MAHSFKAVAAVFAVVCVPALCGLAAPAHAWGDEGHEVIGLIAEHYLEPAVRAKVNAILAGDTTGLTSSTRIDQEATWAEGKNDASPWSFSCTSSATCISRCTPATIRTGAGT